MHKYSMPADGAFPHLEHVLDAPRFTAAFQDALHDAGRRLVVHRSKVRRVFYRPDRSCRLLLECRLQGDGAACDQLYFGVLWRDSPPPAWRDAEALLVPPTLGPACVHLHGLGLTLWAYPNDPDLPGLAALATPATLLAWMQQNPVCCGLSPTASVLSLAADRVKYVPGQRCGFHCVVHWRNGGGRIEAHRLYAKAYPPGRGEPCVDILRQIENTEACRSGGLRVPHVYGFDAARGILWQEFVSGTKLAKDESAESLRRHAAGAGRALAAFHSSALALGPGKDLASQVADLHAACASVARSYPAHRDECARITDRLLALVPRLPDVPRAPVHGSFKSSHLFEDKGQLVLIDFDGAGLGDPIYDVGRFLSRVVAGGAHTLATAETIGATIATFREVYRQGVPWGWPELRVRWSTCAHLIGSHVYKSVKRANSERVAATLRAAAAWLPDANDTAETSPA